MQVLLLIKQLPCSIPTDQINQFGLGFFFFVVSPLSLLCLVIYKEVFTQDRGFKAELSAWNWNWRGNWCPNPADSATRFSCSLSAGWHPLEGGNDVKSSRGTGNYRLGFDQGLGFQSCSVKLPFFGEIIFFLAVSSSTGRGVWPFCCQGHLPLCAQVRKAESLVTL